MYRGQPTQGVPFQAQPSFGGYASPNRFPSQLPQQQPPMQPPVQTQFQPQMSPQTQPPQQAPQPQMYSPTLYPPQYQPQQIQPQQFQPSFQPAPQVVQMNRPPPSNTPPPQQPVVQQPFYEVHHVERPLEVITIDEIENPWRLKCATLERQILELQIQLRKGQPSETIEVVDDTKVKQLEKQLEELRHISNDRDNEIDMLQGRINELMAQIEESNSSQTVTYLTTEVETWKRKYKELEVELKNSEKELAQADAELNRLKRQDQANSQQLRNSGTRKTITSK